MVAMADAVEINGIYYNLVPNTGEAEVTSNPSGARYTGKVVIPEKVNYDGKDYDVTRIGNNAFEFCENLTGVDIPCSVKIIGESAFTGCEIMGSITIPDNVTTIGRNAFSDCIALTSVTIPKGVTRLETKIFSRCSGLTSVNILGNVTHIGESVFNGCINLTSFTIPSGVTVIDQYAFYGCTGLTSITIPNKVTEIGSRAFYGCTGLKSVTIGSAVKKIVIKTFANCTNLEHVYCLAESVPNTYTDAFDGSYPEATTLHVPAASIEAYKSTAPWSTFNLVTAISGSDPGALKCATPTIKINGGELTFECETEGVTFNAAYSYNSGSGNVVGNKMILAGATTCHVTVYATKEGYQDSDVATTDVELQVGKRGDVNLDGVVSITDAVTVVNIILNNGEATAPALKDEEEIKEPE